MNTLLIHISKSRAIYKWNHHQIQQLLSHAIETVVKLEATSKWALVRLINRCPQVSARNTILNRWNLDTDLGGSYKVTSEISRLKKETRTRRASLNWGRSKILNGYFLRERMPIIRTWIKSSLWEWTLSPIGSWQARRESILTQLVSCILISHRFSSSSDPTHSIIHS